MPDSSPDVLVAGLGPAGRAVAARAARAGLTVTAVDPQPERPWTATYAAWADELPDWLPAGAVASHIATPSAWTTHPHVLDRSYTVLDTPRLQECLSLDGVTVVRGRVHSLDAGGAELADGQRLHARHVVDARGVQVSPRRAQQTAFGRVADSASAASALEGHQAWFMDWRRDNGTDETSVPSFLYAMPLGDGTTLLEETCLVGRPALPLQELQRRLDIRLAARGVRLAGDERVERVRFSVEGERRVPGVIGYGARGGLMHPATGYAVATALSTADALVEALQEGTDPQRVLWPVSARTVAGLRAVGLRVLLRLDAKSAAEFFGVFLDLPVEQQRAYLSRRDASAAVAGTMWTLFGRVPRPLRGTILRSVW